MPFPPNGFLFDPRQAEGFKQPFGNSAGYGMELPVEAQRQLAQRLASEPSLSIEKCIAAVRDVLSATLTTAELAPWLAVPFRGQRRTSPLIRAVLNVSAAINPAANAAGIALAAANSTIAPVLLLTPVANEPLDLFTVTCERSHTVKLDTWGVSVINAPPEALVTGVRGATVGGMPDPPRPGVCTHQVEMHQHAEGLISEGKNVTVTVQNLTNAIGAPATPLLVYFAVSWWLFPVNRWMDNKEDTKLRSGFGTECKR
jgi:hypothetical protein